MRKKIFLNVIGTLFITSSVLAQAKMASTMIEKENRSAVMIEINQPTNITTDALEQRLQRAGLKEKIKKGAGSYKGVVLSEISKDKIDLYTKVEQGPNNSSVVYMAVSRGYNNFTNGEADSLITQNVEIFLNSFVQDANNRSSDVGISNQINDVNREEKQYQQLLNEQKDLENKKSKIENRLAEVQNELDTKKIEIERKKTAVQDAKTQRNTSN